MSASESKLLPTTCSLVSSTEEHNAKSELYDDNKIELTWQYGQGDYVEEKEYLTYDHNDFVADFGGYLGLLLGHSVLTCYDWVVLLLERLRGAKWTAAAAAT